MPCVDIVRLTDVLLTVGITGKNKPFGSEMGSVEQHLKTAFLQHFTRLRELASSLERIPGLGDSLGHLVEQAVQLCAGVPLSTHDHPLDFFSVFQIRQRVSVQEQEIRAEPYGNLTELPFETQQPCAFHGGSAKHGCGGKPDASEVLQLAVEEVPPRDDHRIDRVRPGNQRRSCLVQGQDEFLKHGDGLMGSF